MTTATNPGNYVDFDEYVGLKLEKTRSTIRTTDVLTALAGVAAMFLGYLLVFVVMDQWVVRGGFGIAWRWVLLSTLMTATIAWLVWKIGVPSFRAINGLFAAQEIEKAEPGLKSNLLNLIDLKATGRAINPSIRMAMERQAAIRLQHVDISHAIDHRPLVRTAYILLAVIVIFCFYALFSPKKISNSIWRGLLPASEVPVATVTDILDVKPGDLTVQAHQPFVDVQVDLAGELPAQVLLLYSTADGKQDQPIELRPDQQGETRFKGQLIGEGVQGLMYDVTYYIRAGDATSRQYKITVEQPPFAEIESVRIEFPSYMKLQPIDQANNGGIDAWEGAKVLISAKTNMPVRSAMIQFLDDPQAGPTGEEIPMSVTGSGQHLQAHWAMALRSDGSFPKYYRIHCRTEDGRVTTGHVMNPLTIRPDLPPEIVLMHPERDLDAPANAIIALLAQARDPDFELGYVYLNVEKAGQKIVHEVLSEGRQPKLTIKHDLSLAKLNAAVGDVFEIWIEAYDNKQPRPNTKNTPKVKIQVLEAVSQKQAQDQLAEQKERVDQKLAEADQETNADQTDAARPKDDDPRERQPQNAARPEDADPNPRPNPPEDKPQEGEQGQKQRNQQRATGDKNQSGDQKSGSGAKGTQKGEADQNQSDSSKDPSDRGSKSEKPLPSDGSQDDAVLQRLNELINKNNQPKPGQSDDRPSAENPQPASDDAQSGQKTQSPKDKPETGTGTDTNDERPKPKPGRKQNDSTEVGKPRAKDPKQKPDSNDNPNTPEESISDPKPDSASKDENRANQKKSKEEMKDENGLDGNPPKTISKNAAEQNKTAGEQADPTQPPEKKQKDQTSEKSSVNPDKNSTGTPDRTKRSDTKPQDQTDEKKEADDKADGSKPDSKRTEDPSDTSSKPSSDKKPDPTKKENGTGQNVKSKSEQKDDAQSPAKVEEKPENQDSKTDTPSNKDLPTGMNKNAPKQSATEKGTAGKPKNDSTNPASKPEGQREQAPDSPDAKKEAADGTEKGIGKPDRDPNAKPNPTKNENVKRDPKEKPETRPSQSPQDPSDVKPDEKAQPKRDDGQPKPGPQNDDSKDPQSPDPNDKSQDPTDGKQDGSKSGQPGKPQDKARKSDQNSKDTSGQKTRDKSDASDAKNDASSKDDDKPESDSDSSSKPDSGESGSKPSSSSQKSGQGEKPPGSSKEKNSADKPSNDKKQSGSKSKDDQSGRGKKDDKSSKPASDKSDQGESSKSESGKSESEGGKGDGSESGKGQGGKPGGKASQKPSNQPAGPNTNGGNGGESSGGVADATKGGDVAPTEESDDANLEYNKQATELILQKLKKDLDRGDVDPELLEQLGWTKTEMKQFADRLSKSLSESESADETAEGKARQQQFQEMLKNLNLQKSAAQRSGTKEPKRDVDQIESKRSPPPPVYRSANEKWTREMARQKPSTSEKPAKKE